MNGLAFAIVGHLVGDYLFQNDWMATNKKKSTWICAVHCLLWTASVTLIAGWFAWWVPLVLFATHFAQDRTTIITRWMRLIRQPNFLSPPLAPWSIIVVDNVWHIVTLAIVARCLGITL